MLMANEAKALAKRLNRPVGTAADTLHYVLTCVRQAAEVNRMKVDVEVPDDNIDWLVRQLRGYGYVAVPGHGSILVSWEDA